MKCNLPTSILVAAMLLGSAAQAAECPMLHAAEGPMIAGRANFYISTLNEKRNLADLRGAAVWNNETAKAKTLQQFEDELTGEQLHAISQAGCPASQGAAFNKSVDLIVGQSVIKILTASTTIEQATAQLTRLARSKSIADIPADLRGPTKN